MLTYLTWTMPALMVIGGLASSRIGTLRAAVLGLVAAFLVALASAPVPFGVGDAAVALGRGAWIGGIVVPYIFGGLLFWQVAIRSDDAPMGAPLGAPAVPSAPDARLRRRRLFLACFLVGPFAESATGFGIGILGTVTLARPLGIKVSDLLAFGLLSQTMVLWGGMGSGVIVGAAFARTDPTVLAVHASWFLVAFHAAWLPIYWRLADQAGVAAGWRERLNEAGWLVAGLVSAIAATVLLGPEAALLAAYGPLIVLRYAVDVRPDRNQVVLALRRTLPFILLIGWLALTRVAPWLAPLKEWGRVQPFTGGPAWAPLFHAGTWLIVAAVLTGLLQGTAGAFRREVRRAWRTGRLAILTVVAFAMMAELLSGSGIASGLANGLFGAFGRPAIAVTAFISAVFGAMANTGSAPNGLFMSSQISLANAAGLNVAAVIAFQYAAALSLNFVSPVRMSIVCGLAEAPGMERTAWRSMLPFVVAVFLMLTCAAVIICAGAI